MARRRSTASAETADPDAVAYEGRHPNAAATDTARLQARGEERARIRKAQRLVEGEKARQKARTEREKIAADSRKAVEKRHASA